MGWSVQAAAGTTISGLELWWVAVIGSFANEPGRVEVLAPSSVYRLEAPSLEQGARFGGEFARGPGSQSSAYGERNHQTYQGLSAQSATLMAWCLSSCQGKAGAGITNVATLEAYRLKTVVDDPTPPSGSMTGLADGARMSAPATVSLKANDVGGGVREIALRVDGRVVQRSRAGEQCADIDAANSDPHEYSRMQPCPPELAATFTLSPSELADGARHVVSAVATDAAGQERVIGTARAALAAPNGFFVNQLFVNPDLDVIAPRALNGTGAGPGNVELSFVVRRGKRVRFVDRRLISASDRAVVRGRLTTASGDPISGARIWRAVSVRRGAWQIYGTPLVTAADGTVSDRLPARNPSREIRLVYFPYSDTSEALQSLPRWLDVRAATTLQADQAGYRNGEIAKYSGRITTRPIVSRKLVYLQAIVRGRWQTFTTARASSNGRWHVSRKFEATRRPTIYRLRAVVPAQAGGVWATGYSRTMRVFVTP